VTNLYSRVIVISDRIDWPWLTDKPNNSPRSRTVSNANYLPIRTNDNATRRTATYGRSSNYNSNILQNEAPRNESRNSVNQVQDGGSDYNDDDDDDDGDHDFRLPRTWAIVTRPYRNHQQRRQGAADIDNNEAMDSNDESDVEDSDWPPPASQFSGDVTPPAMLFISQRLSRSEQTADVIWNKDDFIEEDDGGIDPAKLNELARRLSVVTTRNESTSIDLRHEVTSQDTLYLSTSQGNNTRHFILIYVMI